MQLHSSSSGLLVNSTCFLSLTELLRSFDFILVSDYWRQRTNPFSFLLKKKKKEHFSEMFLCVCFQLMVTVL